MVAVGQLDGAAPAKRGALISEQPLTGWSLALEQVRELFTVIVNGVELPFAQAQYEGYEQAITAPKEKFVENSALCYNAVRVTFDPEPSKKGRCTMDQTSFSFVIYMIHACANKWHMLPSAVYRKLQDAGCIDQFLVPHYDILHTQGTDYIVEDICEYLNARGVSV